MSIEDLIDYLRSFIQDSTTSVGPGIAILLSLGIAVGLYLLVRYLLLDILLRKLAPKNSKWFQKITAARIPHLLTLLVPPMVIGTILPYFSLDTNDPIVGTLSRLTVAYVVLVITLVLNGALLAINQYYDSLDYSRTFPISSILDVVRVVLFVLAAVVLISILFHVQSIYLLTAIGALIAAGTVVFNNLILAFVSGLILISKHLIVIGDWIEIPELHINGEIQELTLTTVIVRNLDHTTGAVPSTYLLTNTFKNWRGVREEGARKIFLPVYFDVKSVRRLDPELLSRIASLPDGAEILQLRKKPGTPGNSNPFQPVDSSSDTNLGLFREYFARYLRNHPEIAAQKLLSVYLEPPTKVGIPMQVLASTHETDYTRFLDIRSSLVEDLLRMAGKFDLKVYQLEDRLDRAVDSEAER